MPRGTPHPLVAIVVVLLVLVVLPLWVAWRTLRFILRLAFWSGVGSQLRVGE